MSLMSRTSMSSQSSPRASSDCSSGHGGFQRTTGEPGRDRAVTSSRSGGAQSPSYPPASWGIPIEISGQIHELKP